MKENYTSMIFSRCIKNDWKRW